MESNDLATARAHLSAAERAFPGAATEMHLDEGLYTLEAIAVDGGAEAVIADNLGNAYAERVSALINSQLDAADVPEPTLKRLFRLSQILEGSAFSNTDAGVLRRRVAERWVDALLEGYSEAEKRATIERLMAQIADDSD